MKKKCFYVLMTFIIACSTSLGQEIQLLHTVQGISFRGMSVVNDSIIWVSGTRGTIVQSFDGGQSWKHFSVPGFERRDFRDIQAFDAATAIVIAIDTPAQILYTADSGRNWRVVFEDHRAGMFLDALDFVNQQEGFAIGDPVNGEFFLAKTTDGGLSWQDVSGQYLSRPDSVEAFFAASGTNIIAGGTDQLFAVSGGLNSYFHVNKQKFPLPLLRGKSTTGANGMLLSGDRFYIVGGDFSTPNDTTGNLVILQQGKYLQPVLPVAAPSGYRSGIAAYNHRILITCGMNGVDWSTDGGLHWQQISTQGYHVIQKSRNGNSIFLAGGGGRIARFVVE